MVQQSEIPTLKQTLLNDGEWRTGGYILCHQQISCFIPNTKAAPILLP
jgi:hypothetical protein